MSAVLMKRGHFGPEIQGRCWRPRWNSGFQGTPEISSNLAEGRKDTLPAPASIFLSLSGRASPADSVHLTSRSWADIADCCCLNCWANSGRAHTTVTPALRVSEEGGLRPAWATHINLIHIKRQIASNNKNLPSVFLYFCYNSPHRMIQCN